MDTQTFWTTVGLVGIALVIIAPLAHRALEEPPHERVGVHVTGAFAALSFTMESGLVAAVMTLPWLCLGAALALHQLRSIGVSSLVRRPSAVVLGPFATWAWMTVGGGWLTAHRLGVEPFGFDRAVTLLTVAHFHVAGLGLTALLAATQRRRPRRTLLAAIWLHQAGMLVVAAGLTFSDHLEVAGAAAITVALAVWAAIAVAWIRDTVEGLARVLLVVATTSWILPMGLALGWALGPFLPRPVVNTFTTMLRFHAALQTVGLVLCGLAGVVLAGPSGDAAMPAPAIDDTAAAALAIDDTATEDHHDVDHHTHA